MLKRVDNIGIAVRDLGRTLAFFQDKLGVAPSRPYEPGQTGNSISFGEVSFYVFQTAREDSPAVGRTPNFPQNPAGIDHISIEVDDIEDAGRQLEARGVAFEQDIVGERGQFRWRGFQDPDGNMFYIIQRGG